MLLPAERGRDHVVAERDRVLREESRRRDRLAAHEAYLAAIERGDEAVIVDLAVRQVGYMPADKAVLAGVPGGSSATSSADPFLRLRDEPSAGLTGSGAHAELMPTPSTLESLVVDRRLGRWAMVGGGVCVLWSLLMSLGTGRR